MKLTMPVAVTAADSDSRTISGTIVTWNEQGRTSAGLTKFAKNSIALKSVKLFLLSLPTGMFVAVAVWLLLRFVRCYVYKFVRNATGQFCGNDLVTNPFNRSSVFVIIKHLI